MLVLSLNSGFFFSGVRNISTYSNTYTHHLHINQLPHCCHSSVTFSGVWESWQEFASVRFSWLLFLKNMNRLRFAYLLCASPLPQQMLFYGKFCPRSDKKTQLECETCRKISWIYIHQTFQLIVPYIDFISSNSPTAFSMFLISNRLFFALHFANVILARRQCLHSPGHRNQNRMAFEIEWWQLGDLAVWQFPERETTMFPFCV